MQTRMELGRVHTSATAADVAKQMPGNLHPYMPRILWGQSRHPPNHNHNHNSVSHDCRNILQFTVTELSLISDRGWLNYRVLLGLGGGMRSTDCYSVTEKFFSLVVWETRSKISRSKVHFSTDLQLKRMHEQRLGIYVLLRSTVCTKFTTFAKEGMFHPASVGLLEG